MTFRKVGEFLPCPEQGMVEQMAAGGGLRLSSDLFALIFFSRYGVHMEILQLMLYCITPYFQIDHVQKKFCSLSPFLINLTFTHTILGYQIPKGLCWHLSPRSMWSGGFIIPIHRPVDGALDLYGPLLILNDCTAYQLP